MCPNLSVCYACSASINGMLRHYERALKDANRAIELDKSNVFAYCNKGLVLYAMSEEEKSEARIQESLNVCSKATSLNPNFARRVFA